MFGKYTRRPHKYFINKFNDQQFINSKTRNKSQEIGLAYLSNSNELICIIAP